MTDILPTKKYLAIQSYAEHPANYQLVDVRSPNEYAAGHIPGAMNIPLEEVEFRVADLAKERPVVLACQSGTRAEIAAGLLAPSYLDILILRGGTDGWTASDRPLVRTVASRWAIERQVRFVAGLLILFAVVLSFTVDRAWMLLAAFVGAGLTFAGLTNTCGMGILLAKMPWNKSNRGNASCARAESCSD